MRPFVVVGLIAFVAQADSQPLRQMVATERAFAAATAEVGVRNGFLTFFADDAVAVRAGRDGSTVAVVPAKDGLRAQPLESLPAANQLLWEPATGAVSRDGSIGWLTGPYTRIDRTTRALVAKGAYFSVWRRQSDGTWRVWLDEGVTLPEVWKNDGAFVPAPSPDAASDGAPGESVSEVEREIAPGGDAWRARLSSTVRLHRAGLMPLVGRDAALEWSRQTWTAVRFTVVRTELAASNDLAITIGGYDATLRSAPSGAAAAEHGTGVRVWTRAVSGPWRIVFETSKVATP